MLASALAACSGGGSGTSAGPTVQQVPTASPSPTPVPGPSAQPADANLRVPTGFLVSTIAHVGSARQLAALPNGDLIVGTSGSTVAIVPGAESPGATGAPLTFASLPDGQAQGVAFGGGFVFVATTHGVYRIPYATGALSGTPAKIATVRPGPNPDDGHNTSSVAVSGSTLYVSIGSSCNACTETDPTRATIQRMGLDGAGMTTQAKRWRNALALATDPTTGTVWAGGAGQDGLAQGHPYEPFDPVSTRTAPADYGWPDCEENRVAYTGGANCASVVVPAVAFPAYSTVIAAAFYPAGQPGSYAFPAAWKSGAFVSMHGSWHEVGGVPVAPPRVAFVPFSGSAPARAVSWTDPTTQWTDFFTGFQSGAIRFGRTSGVAVGSQGSLFVADDDTGAIYRIRPSSTATSGAHRR